MTDTVSAGFLLIDKPSVWTSHDVVAKVRGVLRVKKVGHAGTLDPLATGLVVVGLQRATRLLRFVQSAPKEYVATAVFGVATDSLDADGAILERAPMDFTEAELRTVMDRFVGTIAQVPPMVSARKVGGKKLYELASEAAAEWKADLSRQGQKLTAAWIIREAGRRFYGCDEDCWPVSYKALYERMRRYVKTIIKNR